MTTANTRTTQHPAYMHIRQQLLRRIGRQWKAGYRLPSIRELAAELGAGHVNTHRAVKALTGEGVLIAKHRVGVFVANNLHVNDTATDRPASIQHLARPLAGLRVDVLVNVNSSDPFLAQEYEAFEKKMREHKCDVTRHAIGMDGEEWHDQSHRDCEALAIFTRLAESGIRVKPDTPVVVCYHGLNRNPRLERLTEFDIVGVDQHHGGLLAGQCLRDAGAERICFLGRRARVPQGQPRGYQLDALSLARLKGFEEGLGRPVEPPNQLVADFYHPGPAARIVPQFLALDPRPTAVFAASDDLAIGFIHGAQSHGLEPRRDYDLVGFDGQQLGRELHEGPLTTIDVPTTEMGGRAAELLAERMLDPTLPRRQLNLGCRLFRGNTVRDPRQRSDDA